MAGERRSLTAGLAVVPPGTDEEAVRAFVRQESTAAPQAKPQEAASPKPPTEVSPTAVEPEPTPASKPVKPRRSTRKGTIPVGLIPVTVRLKGQIAGGLKRASLERQLDGEEVFTQQDIVELALEPWLRENGYLS